MLDVFKAELVRLSKQCGYTLDQLYVDYNLADYISKKERERDPIAHAQSVINQALAF